MSDVSPRFYTTEEAAALSRFTPQSLAARRSRGLPPEWRKIGGKVVYPIEPFEEWLLGEVDDGEDENASDGAGATGS